jgi:hypothetical protein
MSMQTLSGTSPGKSHVSQECLMSHRNVSHLKGMSHVSREQLISHGNVSCLLGKSRGSQEHFTGMSHTSQERVTSHRKISWERQHFPGPNHALPVRLVGGPNFVTSVHSIQISCCYGFQDTCIAMGFKFWLLSHQNPMSHILNYTCSTPLRPAGGHPLKRPYGHFRGGRLAAYRTGSQVPSSTPWTPHAAP